jgi:hypothetical protein
MSSKRSVQSAARRGLLAATVVLACYALVDPVAKSAKSTPSVSASESAGPAVTRRLTQSQYRATVAQIFGSQIPVVGRFEREMRSDGLIAVGTSESGISAFSIEQYDASARGVAAAVVSKEHREELLPCQPAAKTEFDKRCAQRIVEKYGPLLFRRPLTRQENARFVDHAQLGYKRLGDFYQGIEFALAGLMMAPDFLLRIERVEPDPKHSGQYALEAYSKATRLSYFLTNATPDAELLKAAGAGELDSEAGLARQVERLMASPRFAGAVRAFFRDMLQFELFEDLAKDPTIYPAYTSVVAADAQEQTLRTITDHLLANNSDYRALFTTDHTFLTRSLGRIYRLPVTPRNGWERAQLPASESHAGILTHVSFVALHSHPGRTSATLRGKAIQEIFLCQHVPDPPPDVDFSAVDQVSNNALSPTARDRLAEHQTNPSCTNCHKITDPLGLTLENFDGIGAFRTIENDTEIDVSGSLDGTEFSGAPGLGKALLNHPQTPRCLVHKLYRSAIGRNLVADEKPYLEKLNERFAQQGYRVPALMRAIALSPVFYAVAAPDIQKHIVATATKTLLSPETRL